MKEPKEMEEFYEEDKDLSPEQKVKKIREESERFMTERGIHLRRIKNKQPVRI